MPIEPIGILCEFITVCDRQNLTPSDRHIKYFLTSLDRLDLEHEYIKFVFYHWENRHQKIIDYFNEKY